MTQMETGLNMANLDETSPDEVAGYLSNLLRNRGPIYEVTSSLVWFDERPDFAKRARWGGGLFGSPDPTQIVLSGIAHLFTYVNVCWEAGILNEFKSLQRQGMTKAQLMEVVMVAQLSGGFKGLEAVYRAVGMLLRDFQDRPTPVTWPDGWAPDPAAFKSGIDLSTRSLTDQDRRAIFGWYERTIGQVPRSIQFAADYHPDFLKAYRLKWEGAMRGALPKQVMPYLMLRHNTFNGFTDGIREAALLGRAWGMNRRWIAYAATCTAYYCTGMDGLHAADHALRELFENWDDGVPRGVPA
jgi:hypothetical protein